jgi:hypothetical protein
MARGNYEYIRGKGNRFSKDNQPKNPGRKPALYTIAKKAYGVTRGEWNRVKMFLLGLNLDGLNKVIADTATPVWVLTLAKGLKADMERGKTTVLNDIEDRIFGKPTNNVAVSAAMPETNFQEELPEDMIFQIADKLQDKEHARAIISKYGSEIEDITELAGENQE